MIYTYQYNGYDVIEVYKQEEKGTIRLIALNQPEKQNSDKFELENDKLLLSSIQNSGPAGKLLKLNTGNT
jgi:hypothetical protein